MNVILLSGDDVGESCAVITQPAQVHHVRQVLHANVGDYLKIAKLGHRLGVGRITKMDKTAIYLDDVCLDKAPPDKFNLTLVLALPRPKVLRRLIMDMTAIGVRHIVLVNSYRTDKSYWQSPILDKLDDFVAEGLQQGVDSVPPKLSVYRRFKPFVEDVLPSLGKRIVVAHPYTHQAFSTNTALPDVLIVGAEGGFIPYEIDLLTANGATALTLGERILRTEAAVNALLGRWLWQG